MLDKIILEYRAIESEEENETKHAISSDDESVMYSRRDSQESNASSASKASTSSQDSTDDTVKHNTVENNSQETEESSVDELAEQLVVVKLEEKADGAKKSQEAKSDVEELADDFVVLKVEDEKTDEDESLEKLKTKLALVEEDDLQGRQPERHPSHQNRGTTYPYQQTRSVNHYSGGSVSQNERLNIDFGQLQPSRAQSASPPQLVEPQVDENGLPVLNGDLSWDLNNMPPLEPELEFSELYTNLPPGPQSSFATLVPVENVASFSQRQATPTHSVSPGSTPTYWSSSPLSSDVSQSIGSPHSSLSMPSTSRLSLASSPSRLPSVLPNTSDEEEDLNQEGTTQLRNLIDNEMKQIKMHEWILANVEEVHVLISKLRILLCKNTRLNDRKLVKIYAVISSILKQNGPLRQFFLDEQCILSCVALKNHPLLLKYIIETMQNLGLCPGTIGESPTAVLRKVIEQNQDMREILKVLLTLKTKTGSMMFDMNEVDQDGLTAIHRVLLKITQMEDPEMKNLAISYLKICLEHRPDFTVTTRNKRTYLHHAVALDCGPHVVAMILRYCATQNPIFDLVNQNDVSGDCALRLAANLTQGRKEVEDVLLQYNVFNVYQDPEDQNSLNF